MTASFFEEVAAALAGFLPRDLRDFGERTSSRNLKVWFEEPNEHYEVQAVRLAGSRAARALEIGFHAEHRTGARNDEVLAHIGTQWRKALGRGVEAGAFLGRQREWRRISETWDGPNLHGPEAAIEAAERLARYISVVEPLRRRR